MSLATCVNIHLLNTTAMVWNVDLSNNYFGDCFIQGVNTALTTHWFIITVRHTFNCNPGGHFGSEKSSLVVFAPPKALPKLEFELNFCHRGRHLLSKCFLTKEYFQGPGKDTAAFDFGERWWYPERLPPPDVGPNCPFQTQFVSEVCLTLLDDRSVPT